MVHASKIEASLSKLNIKLSGWFRAELRELQQTMTDDEEIVALVCGRYYGGYALLAATNHRVLLIDKKTFFMALEDIRYDMISEINFSSHLLDSTITLFTVNKQHRFTSFKHKNQLRGLTNYVQKRVIQLRSSGPVVQQSPTVSLMPTTSKFWPDHLRQVTHQLIGAAALGGAAWYNPYTNGSVTVRRQWSRMPSY